MFPRSRCRCPLSDLDQPEIPFSAEWYAKREAFLGKDACRQLGFYKLPDGFVLSVVIPVYNERNWLHEILKRVRALPIRKEIVLVDDFSRDGTREMLQELQAQPQDDPMNKLSIQYHDRNRGKGAAVRTGFRFATGNVVVIQDADLEYNPAELPRLLQPLIDNEADCVFGSRFLGDQPHRVLYWWHYLGNCVLTILSNCFTNLNLTDMETCYKLFRKEVLADIGPRLKQDRFGIEPEITARVARGKYRIMEMSISYSGRTYEQGKKIGWRDGFKALWCIVRYGMWD